MVRFSADDAESKATPYDRAFVEGYLGLPDFFDEEILCYRGPRDLCMREKPEPRSVPVLTPVGPAMLHDVRGAESLRKKYDREVKWALYSKLRSADLEKVIMAFVRCSGLIVLDPQASGMDQSHQSGSLVM